MGFTKLIRSLSGQHADFPPQEAASQAVHKKKSDSTLKSKGSKTEKLKNGFLRALHLRNDSAQEDDQVAAPGIPLPLPPNGNIQMILPPDHPDARQVSKPREVASIEVLSSKDWVLDPDELHTALAALPPTSDIEESHADAESEALDESALVKELAEDSDEESPAAIHMPELRSEAYEPKIAIDTSLTHSQLRLRRFFKAMAYAAAAGKPYPMEFFLWLKKQALLPPLHDPIINYSSVSFRRTEMGEREWNQVNRALTVRTLWNMLSRKRISPDDADVIIMQMFPEEECNIMMKENWEVYMDTLVEQGVFSSSTATEILKLQVSVDEFLGGSAAILVPAPRLPLAQFNGQLGTVFNAARYMALKQLIEATAYTRSEWKGVAYEDAIGTFKSYYDAFDLNRQGLQIPIALQEYARNWSFLEQRLLRRGNALVQLLGQYTNGSLADYTVFKAVRGTLLPNFHAGQPYYDPAELETFLYDRAQDSGLRISDIPHILILHPEYDERITCVHAEARKVSGLLADSWRFEEDERDRLDGIARARACFDVVMNVKSGRRKSSRVKGFFKKVFGKK